MRAFIAKNSFFLLCWSVWALFITPVILFIPKGVSHLFINRYHLPLTDIFFKYFTNLGDGLMPFIIALVMAFFSYRKSILILASGIISGLLAQILKRIIFINAIRPAKFFESSTLHFVDGVKMYLEHSFPSGHSATIFALCLCLASLTTSNLKKIVLFCTAILVAFSRVYLSQHFLMDIYAGSIIGILSAAVVIIYLDKQNNSWLDSSFIKTLKLSMKG
jgi:membrane-associated phospholipid phosphatase